MSRDLRSYARQTEFRLLAGFILILFIIGDGLVYLIYGREAAILGLVCLLAGLSPLFLIWLTIAGMDWLVRRHRQ